MPALSEILRILDRKEITIPPKLDSNYAIDPPKLPRWIGDESSGSDSNDRPDSKKIDTPFEELAPPFDQPRINYDQ